MNSIDLEVNMSLLYGKSSTLTTTIVWNPVSRLAWDFNSALYKDVGNKLHIPHRHSLLMACALKMQSYKFSNT